MENIRINIGEAVAVSQWGKWLPLATAFAIAAEDDASVWAPTPAKEKESRLLGPELPSAATTAVWKMNQQLQDSLS